MFAASIIKNILTYSLTNFNYVEPIACNYLSQELQLGHLSFSLPVLQVCELLFDSDFTFLLIRKHRWISSWRAALNMSAYNYKRARHQLAGHGSLHYPETQQTSAAFGSSVMCCIWRMRYEKMRREVCTRAVLLKHFCVAERQPRALKLLGPL